MISLKKCIPQFIAQGYRRLTKPHQKHEVVADYAYAKYKEVRELLNQARNLNATQKALGHRFFYPTHLTQKVQELFQLYKQTPSYQKLHWIQKLEIEKLSSINNGEMLSRAFYTCDQNHLPLQDIFTSLMNSDTSSIVKLDINNPFYKTDLVVYQDSYYGPLPENAIYEKELDQLTDFYYACTRDNKYFGIKGSGWFKTQVFSAIKKLLTRQIGRDLLRRAAGQNWSQYLFEKISLNTPQVSIRQSPIRSCLGSSDFKSAIRGIPTFVVRLLASISPTFKAEDRYTIFLTEKRPSVHVEINNQLYLLTLPYFITLGHEFLHLAHRRSKSTEKYKAKDPNELYLYTNEEEKVTITGELNQTVEDSISENSLRKAFGFFPRKYHSV